MLRFVIKLPTKLPSPGKLNPAVQQNDPETDDYSATFQNFF